MFNLNSKNLTIKDQILFSQKLSLLLDSNISLVDSLKIIKDMETSINKIRIYDSLILNCEKGLSLSRSIRVLNLKFNYTLIIFIRNGEQTGTLPSSLLFCSKNLDKNNEISKKLISTLIYPIFIFIATVFMSCFLIMYIFPKILPMLDSLNIELPLMTRIVRSIYILITNYGLYILPLFVVGLIAIIILYRKNRKFKLICHRSLFRIPLISNYIVLNNNLTICSTGEIFLNSGQSLSDFYVFAKDTISNLVYKEAFESVLIDSRKGIGLSYSISKYSNLFNKVMINMIKLGEQTGNLANMMLYLSKIFEQDIDNLLKRFSSLIEPVLMIFMGIVIGSISLSIILPVYAITNHLSH